MKKLLTILISLTIITTVIAIVGPDIFKPSTVRAVGDLIIDFHVVQPNPIFVISNMAPGDPSQVRNIDVTNGGTVSHIVAVKGARTGGVGEDPKLETILDFVINDGTSDIYGGTAGNKTVADFFADSTNPDGIVLGTIHSGTSKTYTFTVTFPTVAGNEFQAKSVIFDIIFGDGTEPTPTNTPTNNPTPTATPTPTPTPSGNLCGDINVDISGNGAGSVNGVFIVCKNNKIVSQTNSTNTITNITTISNTGNNSSSYNTFSSTSVVSGASITNTKVTVKGRKNKNK